ncbi:hypothetical protein MKX01_040175 [Papaver californicum]|nr:hypothetical protein MKX01_040175 [Papaver californicum]
MWTGIKESYTGLAAQNQWDLVSDKQIIQEEQLLQNHIVWMQIYAFLNSVRALVIKEYFHKLLGHCQLQICGLCTLVPGRRQWMNPNMQVGDEVAR